jgi:hypothetical protein
MADMTHGPATNSTEKRTAPTDQQHRKKHSMTGHQHDGRPELRPRGAGDEGPRAEWAAPAVPAKADDRASDRTLDPGDSHDKGERSLCVGEAA